MYIISMIGNRNVITARETPLSMYIANTRSSHRLMASMLQLINIQDARIFTMVSDNANSTPVPTPNTNDGTPIEQYIQELFSNSGIDLEFRTPQEANTMQDVIVRPTREQIAATTSIVRFATISDDANSYSRCPISQETFTGETQVTRINHCGHYFSSFAINRWFEMSCICPVCRHDIRDGLQHPESPTRSASTHEETDGGSRDVSDNDISDPDTP
jgi:hypothetical protein